MIIKKVHIEKFRGFTNSEFTLGEYVTLIAGQNGTQKSTLLGMLSQPFTLSKNSPMHGEKPLSGGNFRSKFKEKFRFSPTFDKPKDHEWTLHLTNSSSPFTIQSMTRDKESSVLRFWRKGNRAAGSGYIQLPVIYLSLKRLFPLGEEEDSETSTSTAVILTQLEKEWFSSHYKKIMINHSEDLSSVDYVKSPNKDTLGVTTSTYDWNTNSAGQDNIGKILLAILSFKRLKEKYNQDYKGGLLAIDEIDATLYPGSQIKLLDTFKVFCKDYKIQIVATTHSLQLLEKADKLKKSRAKQYKTVYLKKEDGMIVVDDNLDFERIIHHLNLSVGKKAPSVPKLPIYTEDPECIHFVRALIGRNFPNISYSNLKFGCGNYIQLSTKKIPDFTFPNSIIVLDGDAAPRLVGKRLKNFICLPGELNPEGMLATFLHNLSHSDPFWKSKDPDYSHQHCFLDFTLDEILADRNQAKLWYNQQLDTGFWGQHANLLYKRFLLTIPDEHTEFISKFKKIYNSTLDSK